MFSDNTALITTTALANLLAQQADFVLLDSTFCLPNAPLSAKDLYQQRHIASAHFFDISTIADITSPYPNTLPKAADFSNHIETFGIDNKTPIVVYDTTGSMGASRAWWMFRVFGHAHIRVLDGGLQKWLAENKPVTNQATPPPSHRGNFTAAYQPNLVATLAEMRHAVTHNTATILDARSPARYHGTEAEPRPNMRSGHMPNSTNTPYNSTVDATHKTLHAPETLKNLFTMLDEKPIITTCGSGITACQLALALYEIGRKDVAVYDGSWTEWGSLPDTPVISS